MGLFGTAVASSRSPWPRGRPAWTASGRPISETAFRRLVLVLAGILAVALVLRQVLTGTAGEYATGVPPLAASATGLVLAGSGLARAPAGERLWRALLIPSVFAIFVGAVEWSFFYLDIVAGYATQAPRPADAAHLVPLLLAMLALVAYPSQSVRDSRAPPSPGERGTRIRSDAVVLIDTLLIVASMTLISWVVLLHESTARIHGLRLVLALTHSLAGTATIVGLLLVLTFRRPRNVRTMALLIAGMSLTTAAEASIIHVTQNGPDPANQTIIAVLGLTIAPLLLGLAIIAPPRRADQQGRERSERTETLLHWAHQCLPYLPFGVATVLVLPRAVRGENLGGVTLQLAVALAALVTIRQVVMIGQNARLLVKVQASQRRLHHQANHDPLTGLANRALFADELDAAVAEHLANGAGLALLYCDVDAFKSINDTYGHAVGDDLLRAVAGRLGGAIRERDLAARLGGDEFAVLLRDTDDLSTASDHTARRITDVMHPVFTLGGRHLHIGLSIGVAVADGSGESVETSEDLLRQADYAMYCVKARGRRSGRPPARTRPPTTNAATSGWTAASATPSSAASGEVRQPRLDTRASSFWSRTPAGYDDLRCHDVRPRSAANDPE
ncbi:GGDEF domain-containing protein [Frankia sp. AgB32]|uniref:diguanylate cyclase domain-containing protein n=1 Tax=Frankia sp. AgB32 TaxID=631119 RepID=UPI00200BA701|nr:GGDEF domain-containing protein [Frankia sp. AgB32]MCK9895934.1 GGDEF domain-containing protein [Frankia sp. AgB32]